MSDPTFTEGPVVKFVPAQYLHEANTRIAELDAYLLRCDKIIEDYRKLHVTQHQDIHKLREALEGIMWSVENAPAEEVLKAVVERARWALAGDRGNVGETPPHKLNVTNVRIDRVDPHADVVWPEHERPGKPKAEETK